MNMRKVKIIFTSVVIIVIALYLSGLKVVAVFHGAYFTKEFYHYTIYITEMKIEYFRNVNPNEISHVKVVKANETQNADFFLTFKDSVEVFVRTDYVDTTRTIPLDRLTKLYVYPTQNVSFIHASNDTISFWD